jgi:hypothetical protein
MLICRRLVISGLILFASCAAAHADWRYCLASSEADHKVFVSAPFLTSASIEIPEAGFERMLQQTNIAHEQVQCPRAPTKDEIKIARKEAIEFNKEFMDRATVELSWTPTSSPSARARPTPSSAHVDRSDITEADWAQMETSELFVSTGR